MQERPAIRVLLVEDNPGDVYLTRLFLERSSTSFALEVAGDGESALERLGLEGDRSPESLPDLILLDLNLPKVDGWELLRRIKSHPALSVIPVVVLSSAQSLAEISSCYRLHAAAFITKLDEPKRMEVVMQNLTDFWFQTATLPQC